MDPSTVQFDADEGGDLTGTQPGTSKFFKTPEYDTGSRTIIIKPGDGGADGTILPPGELVITVTVGMGGLNANANGYSPRCRPVNGDW